MHITIGMSQEVQPGGFESTLVFSDESRFCLHASEGHLCMQGKPVE